MKVPTPQDYQQNAIECLRLAQDVKDTTNRALLCEMAHGWIRLAEQVMARVNPAAGDLL